MCAIKNINDSLQTSDVCANRFLYPEQVTGYLQCLKYFKRINNNNFLTLLKFMYTPNNNDIIKT